MASSPPVLDQCGTVAVAVGVSVEDDAVFVAGWTTNVA
jgi:hypothetical protein